MIGRVKGEGVYIGRDYRVTVTGVAANGITVRIESSLGVVVSDSDFGYPEHLANVEKEEVRFHSGNPTGGRLGRDFILLTDAGLMIGRGVEVTLVSLANDERGRMRAQIAIEAPQHMAVSRDDFTFDQHMTHQERRERRRVSR